MDNVVFICTPTSAGFSKKKTQTFTKLVQASKQSRKMLSMIGIWQSPVLRWMTVPSDFALVILPVFRNILAEPDDVEFKGTPSHTLTFLSSNIVNTALVVRLYYSLQYRERGRRRPKQRKHSLLKVRVSHRPRDNREVAQSKQKTQHNLHTVTNPKPLFIPLISIVLHFNYT